MFGARLPATKRGKENDIRSCGTEVRIDKRGGGEKQALEHAGGELGQIKKGKAPKDGERKWGSELTTSVVGPLEKPAVRKA